MESVAMKMFMFHAGANAAGIIIAYLIIIVLASIVTFIFGKGSKVTDKFETFSPEMFRPEGFCRKMDVNGNCLE